MLEFPCLMYKDGGSHQREGGHFSYKQINSVEDAEKAMADGWYLSLEEAVNGEHQDDGEDAEPVKKAKIGRPRKQA